jgi:hypothetical protein
VFAEWKTPRWCCGSAKTTMLHFQRGGHARLCDVSTARRRAVSAAPVGESLAPELKPISGHRARRRLDFTPIVQTVRVVGRVVVRRTGRMSVAAIRARFCGLRRQEPQEPPRGLQCRDRGNWPGGCWSAHRRWTVLRLPSSIPPPAPLWLPSAAPDTEFDTRPLDPAADPTTDFPFVSNASRRNC